MDYKMLNETLKDLRKLRRGKTEFTEIINEIDGEGDQGEEGLKYEVYHIPKTEFYIRLEIRTDSYGDNQSVTGIQFVKPTEKIVKVFESI